MVDVDGKLCCRTDNGVYNWIRLTTCGDLMGEVGYFFGLSWWEDRDTWSEVDGVVKWMETDLVEDMTMVMDIEWTS